MSHGVTADDIEAGRALERIDVPGRVWEDALDPMASGMQADLGLDNPSWQRRGKGMTARYFAVPVEVALELAEYLDGRGGTLLAQGTYGDSQDPTVKAERDGYRAAIKCAARIRAQVEAVKA